MDLKAGTISPHACNINKKTTQKNQGSLRITLMKKYSQFSEETGKDEINIVIFPWLRMDGKNNINTIFISAYFPCKPK